jgi:hypothetical protein
LLDLPGTTSSGNSPFRTTRSGFQQRDATQMKPTEHIQLLDPSEVKNRPAAQRTRGCARLREGAPGKRETVSRPAREERWAARHANEGAAAAAATRVVAVAATGGGREAGMNRCCASSLFFYTSALSFHKSNHSKAPLRMDH